MMKLMKAIKQNSLKNVGASLLNQISISLNQNKKFRDGKTRLNVALKLMEKPYLQTMISKS